MKMMFSSNKNKSHVLGEKEPLNRHRFSGGRDREETEEDEEEDEEIVLPTAIPLCAQRRRFAACLVFFWALFILVLVWNDARKTTVTFENEEDAQDDNAWSAAMNGGVQDDLVRTFDVDGSTSEEEEDSRQAKNKVVDRNSPYSLYLQNLTCVPSLCFKAKHFVSYAKSLQDPQGFTLLASFPGAGSTWTRSVIEAGTRIYTGSVYPTDLALLHEGFEGERIEATASPFSVVSAIKTHYPLFEQQIPSKIKYAIQVLRSPFDSLLSEFNREYGSGGDPHVHVASLEQFRHDLPQWFSVRSHRAWGHSKFWDGPRFWEQHANNMDNTNDVTSFRIQRSIGANNQTIPVLVLFYEDFVRNFHETSLRMLKFLKETSLGPAMPPTDIALTCALKAHIDAALASKRTTSTHKKQQYNPYTESEGGIYKRGLVAKFCKFFKDYWFEAKWGRCLDAPLQSNRKMPIIHAPPMPTQKCNK